MGRALAGIVLFGALLFAALNWHSHAPIHTYHAELWGDAAGYHVYLPATFVHGWDATAFVGLDTLSGLGFRPEVELGVVRTKYTCGVAWMQLPVYLAGLGYKALTGSPAGAFDPVDHAVVDVAAAAWVALGLLMLWRLLLRRWNAAVSLTALAALLLGTPLLYYTVASPGMSHAYSFALFCAWLRLGDEPDRLGNTGRLFLVGLVAGLIVLVRPTNVVFLPTVLFLGGPLKQRLSAWLGALRQGRWAIVLLAVVVIWTPQLLYWRHTYGSWLAWSYAGEGFDHLLDPRLGLFWTATRNGLFTYAPVMVLAIIGAYMALRRGPRQVGAASLVLFVLVSWIGAAWWDWAFGCGFGSRTLVEHGAFLVLPLSVLLAELQRRFRSAPMVLAVVPFIAWTMKLMYSYDACWYGADRDWAAFFDLLLGPFK